MNYFGKRNSCSQWEGPSMHSRCLAFFPFKFLLAGGGFAAGGRGRRIFFIFPWFPMCSHYVPFTFSMRFHQVLNMFLKFPTFSPTCPPQHLTFIPYALANVVLLSPILRGPKGRNSILQNRSIYFRESP